MLTVEEKKERQREYSRRWWDKNPEKKREYNKRHYDKNRERTYEEVRVRRAAMREKFMEFKSKLSCPCGESRPDALDFHHRDPSQKSFNVSLYLARGWGWERLMEEVSKCDVICANCHRVLEAEKKRNGNPGT